ncbi:MAG: hypothetical protein J6N22_05195, partial [Schwartzia sp.]|nr:hypothetical protein [Schwartzia sp. (in: firmicutes)]
MLTEENFANDIAAFFDTQYFDRFANPFVPQGFSRCPFPSQKNRLKKFLSRFFDGKNRHDGTICGTRASG